MGAYCLEFLLVLLWVLVLVFFAEVLHTIVVGVFAFGDIFDFPEWFWIFFYKGFLAGATFLRNLYMFSAMLPLSSWKSAVKAKRRAWRGASDRLGQPTGFLICPQQSSNLPVLAF